MSHAWFSTRDEWIQKSSVILFAACITVLGVLFLQTARVSAATCTFASAGDSDFGTAANWDCAAIPGDGDDIIIPASTSTFLSANVIVSTVSSTGSIFLGAFSLTATSTAVINSGGGIGATSTGNFAVSSTLDVWGTVSSTSGGITSVGVATVYSGGSVSSTSGLLTFSAAVSSTGSIGSNSGDMSFASTFQNNGTFQVGSGTATSTGALTNAAGATLNNNGGTLSVEAAFTNAGTYNANIGTLRLAGSSSQDVTGSTFYNLASIKTGGTATIVTSNATVGGTLTSTGTGTLSSAALNLTVTGLTSLFSGTVVTSTSGVLTFTGAVTSTGSIGSISGNMSFASTLQNNGTFDLGSGTATTTGAFTNATSGSVYGHTGLLSLASSFTNNGTFSAGSGTVRYSGSSADNVGSAVYNVLNFTGSATHSLTASTTVLSTMTVSSGATVAISTYTLTVVGLITNSGTISQSSSGSIVHTLESMAFTDSAGTTVSSYTAPTTVYITIQDSNRNLDGTALDTATSSITVASAGGSDTVTITLTETAVASGIFRGSVSLLPEGVTTGNGVLEITGSSAVSSAYADFHHGADTGSASATFVKTSSSGGSGGGSVSITVTTPVATTAPATVTVTVSSTATTTAVQPVTSTQPQQSVQTIQSVVEKQESIAERKSLLSEEVHDADKLSSAIGVKRNAEAEKKSLKQAGDDAKEFGVKLAATHSTAISNFITYGVSPSTMKLGAGERRAVVRDYLETMKNGEVKWSDVERLTTGQIPLSRNLPLERQRVSALLPEFRFLFGHNPNFKDAKENLAWNELVYRIRFPRDLVKEAKGLKAYRELYKKDPKSPMAWSVVRVLGYVK